MSEPENYVKKEEPRVSIKQRRKKSIGGTLGTLFAENQSMLMLFAAIVAALAVILTGIIALHMPVVPVCLIVLLETGIACCLHDNIQAGKPKAGGYPPITEGQNTLQTKERRAIRWLHILI